MAAGLMDRHAWKKKTGQSQNHHLWIVIRYHVVGRPFPADSAKQLIYFRSKECSKVYPKPKIIKMRMHGSFISPELARRIQYMPVRSAAGP